MHKKRNLSILLLLILTIGLKAQTYRHPYSIYALGQMYDQTFITNSSMGGLSAAWNDKLSFTPLNPASYASTEYVTFDVGLRNTVEILSQGDITATENTTGLSYFGLGFPIYKKISMAGSFGLMPVSNIGYLDEYSSLDPVDSVDVEESVEYAGGFTKFYFGTSFKLFKKLAIGGNIYYLFGNTEKFHSLEFSSSQYNSVRTETYYDYGKIGFDLGIQYTADLSPNHQLTLGGYYSLPVSLNSNEYTVIQTYELETLDLKDSIKITEEEKNALDIPAKYGVGILFSKTNKWRFGVDYNLTQWSNFKGLDNEDLEHHDYWEVIAGGELIPKYDDPNSYFKRMAFRAGIKYAKSYLAVNDADFQKMSISIGAGIPMPRVASKINIGLEYGQIGKLENDLIKEDFVNINIGLRLNDSWFRKSKIE